VIVRALVVPVLLASLAGCQFDPSGSAMGETLDASVGADAEAEAVDGGRDSDASPSSDAGLCPAMCDSCDLVTQTCEVDCSGSSCDTGVSVLCPIGWTCEISCTGNGACNGGVTCSGDCEITCDGNGACETGAVTCSGAACVVECDGVDTCDNAVRCNAASCDITCTGDGACEDLGVCCDGDDCGGSCSSSNGGSCDCPGQGD
jgi:hypothetical protein